MWRRPTILLLFAVASASAETMQFPSAPAAPTQPSECQALRTQWSDMASALSKQHSACLDAQGKIKNAPSGKQCSYAACEHLHSPLDRPDIKKYREDSIKWCESVVADHRKAVDDANKRADALRNAQRQQADAAMRRAQDLQAQQKAAADRLRKQSDETRKRLEDGMRALKDGMSDQDRYAREARINSSIAGAIAGLEVIDGGMTVAGELAPDGTPLQKVTQAYEAGKTAANVFGAGGTEKAAGTIGKVVGKGLDSPMTEAAGEFITADAERRKGEEIGAAGSAIGGLGTLADKYDMRIAGGFAKGATKTLTVADGAKTAYEGAHHVGESAETFSEAGRRADSNKESMQRRYDDLQQKLQREEQDSLRRLRNVSEPIVGTISNYGTEWGVHADGSVVDMRTGDVFYFDKSGKLVRR